MMSLSCIKTSILNHDWIRVKTSSGLREQHEKSSQGGEGETEITAWQIDISRTLWFQGSYYK